VRRRGDVPRCAEINHWLGYSSQTSKLSSEFSEHGRKARAEIAEYAHIEVGLNI
jgi:hypothetical protein